VEVLTSPATCALSVCHDNERPEANLGLLGLTDLRDALVDKAACQAPALKLVDGRGGDAALTNSWVWQKLTAPVNSSNVLETNPAWGSSVSCKQQPGQTFGVRMPIGATTLAEDKLVKVRDWICAGAPAP
jgi:hypothetical protein